MFGLSKLYAGLGAAVLVLLLLTGCYAKGRHDGKSTEQKRSAVAIAKLQASWDREKAAQMAAAQAHNAAAAQATADAGDRAQAAQTVIQTRYRTLREKVRVYVPTETPPGVIRADDRVPIGALVLLDAAARGDDLDAVSVTSGQSYELASSLRFTELVGGYVDNLGIGHQNAAQLSGLQGWVRAQQELNR